GDALARVDDEERHLRLVERPLGLAAHARFQALVGDVLEAGGVDQLEVDVAEPTRGEAAVAGDARPVVDQRELAARQPVEQGRLADIRPPDDGDLDHGGRILPRLTTGWRSGRPSG